jgi:hypothetical protein
VEQVSNLPRLLSGRRLLPKEPNARLKAVMAAWKAAPRATRS